jgi:hypothetical protein
MGDLFKDDPIHISYDGGHGVVYPDGTIDDAGRGHDEFWQYEVPEVLEKLEKEDPDRYEEIMEKYIDDDNFEGAAWALGYGRISTSPIPQGSGESFSLSVDYNDDFIDPKAKRSLQDYVGKIVDNNYNRAGFGDFKIAVNSKGIEFPTKDETEYLSAREFSDVDDRPQYTGGMPVFDDDEDDAPKTTKKKTKANAINKQTGRKVYFKTPMSLKNAMKSGTHQPIK